MPADFLPVASIEREIDAMSFAKMSVLHWHIVDRESFPLVLESAPQLSQGAWTAEERYSTADVKRIVEFARLRGIRVVPELDLPTHTASWCVGMPELLSTRSCHLEPVQWQRIWPLRLWSVFTVRATGPHGVIATTKQHAMLV